MTARLRPCARAALPMLLLALAACAPEVGQTALVVEVRTDGPVDCLALGAVRPGGEPVRATTLVNAGDWRDAKHRLLVYSGGPLGEDAVALEVTGHRGACDTAVVARGQASAAFVRGDVLVVPLTLALLAADGDADGYADPDDCAPADATVFPRSGVESGPACNGRDDDCDGDVDEGCPCSDARACHPLGLTHPATGVGACVTGLQACTNGVLGACAGAVLPGPETCDGVDTDCDGELDPASCPCSAGATRPCYDAGPVRLAGVGACVRGVQTCTGGSFGACVGAVSPTRETCNGLDDDCNGVEDDEGSLDVAPCAQQDGVCAGARPACTGGTASCTEADYARTAAARGLAYLAQEGTTHCDGVDNDCDGTIDEECACTPGTTEACHALGATRPESATGACRRGTRTCLATARWGPCEGSVDPQPETCNGVDDDCDGTLDEGSPGVGESCATGLPGRCAPGERRCVGGTLSCQPLEPAVAEACDGRDDDCNGAIDNGFDKQNDPAHCGGEFECFACGATDACCGGRCANTATDELHCGTCGNACPAGATCCGGDCALLASNTAHCGACGNACAGGLVCRGARCVPAAEASCADTLDDDNDGATDCADSDCVTGTPCETVDGTTVRICRGGACVPPGETACGDGGDEDNDGATDCGDSDCDARHCDLTNGTCCGGACAHETTCANGTDDDCDGLVDAADPDCPCTGTRCGTICVDTLTDNAHCGACGRTCGDENACTTDRCVNGACAYPNVANRAQPEGCSGSSVCCTGSCVGGTETQCANGTDDDCDGLRDCYDGDCPCPGGTACCSNGCKDTRTDEANCGGCGQVCATTNVCATAACTGGGCDVTTRPDRTACGSGLVCCGGGCGADTENSCDNGQDDDCDGLADCADPDCANKGPAETCNAKDDDCDGSIDEGFEVGTACTAGNGVCMTTGVRVCDDDGTGTCSALPDGSRATTETCDGLDNDCDGTADDGFGVGDSCVIGQGFCARVGTMRCRADKTGTECTGTPGPPARETCNTVDDDCDGSVDERPDCGGPGSDVAENVTSTWTHGRSPDGNTPSYCTASGTGSTLGGATEAVYVKVGAQSVAVNSGDSGSYFKATYPQDRNANWDLSGAGRRLHFWVLGGFSDSDWTWAENGPRIVLCGPSGHRVLTPTAQRMTGTYAEHAPLLVGDANWTVTDSGTFSLSEVDSVEFHVNPNRPSGDDGAAALVLDDVRFP